MSIDILLVEYHWNVFSNIYFFLCLKFISITYFYIFFCFVNYDNNTMYTSIYIYKCKNIWKTINSIRLILVNILYIFNVLCIYFCTVLVVGSDDVAASYYVGVLSKAHGWQKGRKSGCSCGRPLLSWRAPVSSIPKPAVTGFEMKSPDANPRRPSG